jgi:4-hydroxythreonine-4-phosphate dehydrogenase
MAQRPADRIPRSHLWPVNDVTPLVLTPGEPGGIGPEITAKAWYALRHEKIRPFVLIGDAALVDARAEQAQIPCRTQHITNMSEAAAVFQHALPVLHREIEVTVQTGEFSPANAGWVTSAITEAVDLCLGKHASGIVTNPIQKEALYAAGFKHQGHTDFLAQLCKDRGHNANEVMMLVGKGLRAVPITIHIALKDVPQKLTRAAIETQAETVHRALQSHFGIAAPRLAATGLNPHAGENGSMGREEIDIIIPALEALRAKGINIKGPLPADTAFFPEARESYDAILCMYHDQALIPVKTLDFHGGVNVTLGLPIIRTSPDHGTALSLAGTGKANAESLIAAIRLASNMADASGA